MKRFFGLLLGGMLLFFIACGEDSDDDNGAVKPEPQRPDPNRVPVAVQRQDNSFDGHLQRLNNASTPDERVRMIIRTKYVSEEDRPAMISMLADIMMNSPSPYERGGAAVSLIEMNTQESLLPVKKALLFKQDGQLNGKIVATLKRKYASEYNKKVAGWCFELLSDEEIFNEYDQSQIIAGMSIYDMVYTKGLPELDTAIFLQDTMPRVTAKMYDLLRKYPKENVPLFALTSRINKKLNDRSISSKELKSITRTMHYHKIPIAELGIEMTSVTLLWGLEHPDYKMRIGFLDILPGAWKSFGAKDQNIIKIKLESIAQADPEFLENDYPVRERAEYIMKELKIQ